MANSTERGGRKVTGLKPDGQGSGIAEVIRTRFIRGITPALAGALRYGSDQLSEFPPDLISSLPVKLYR
jgi:hypothetical protein